ncbi:E4 SUMO-protein ligase [Nymphaea thermarum]|nr:E4 SUMO-protein ligase [Nymphaea thermarum]
MEDSDQQVQEGGEAIPEISLHTFSGDNVPQSMRMDDLAAKACGRKVVDQPEFEVVGGNGSSLICKGKCLREVVTEPGPQLPSDITGLLKVGMNLLQAIGKFTGSYIIAIAVMATASTPDATLLKEYAQPAVSMLSSVSDDCTAEELWETLADTFSQISEARIMYLKKEFQNLSKGSMPIMDYLGCIKAVTDQLAALGNNIYDKEKVQQTLNGLGHDYHAFITALEVLHVLPSFNELQGKLLQHEMNMKRVIERTDQGNSQNVLSMNVNFGKSHGNSNHGGRGILPTPHNQGKQSDYKNLKVFGCVCYVHVDAALRNKFQDKAIQCRFVGYADEYKGFRSYDPTTKRIKTSRNVIFYEHSFDDTNEMPMTIESYDPWTSTQLFNADPVLENDVPEGENRERSIQSSDIAQSENQEGPTQSSSHHESNSEEQNNNLHRYSCLIYNRRLRDRHANSKEDNVPYLRRSQRIRHPIHRWRIGTPVKGQNCKHIQCFDYNNFMEINSRKPYWRCPHCNQPTRWSDLRIDQNMLKAGHFIVLTEVGQDVSDVLFSNDGSWKPCVEKDAHSDLLPPHSPQFSANSCGVVDLTIETESVVDNGTGLENLNEKTIQDVCTNCNGLEAVDRKPSQEMLDSLVHTEIHSGTSYVHPSAETSRSFDEQIMRDIWLRATSSNYASNGSAVPAASLAASTVPQPNSTYSSGNLVSMPADAVAIMPTRQLVDTPGVYQPTLFPLQSISPGIQVAAEDSSVHHPWIVGNAITEPRRSLIPRNVTRSPLAVQALPAQGQLQTALSRARSTLNANSTVANGPAAPSTGPLMTANPDVGTMEMEQHQLLRPQNNLLGGLEVSSSLVPVWSNSQERQHHPNQPLQSVVGLPTMSQAGLRNTLEQQRIGVPPTQVSSFKDQQNVQYQPNLRVPQTNRQSETIVRQVPTFPPLPVHQSTQSTMGLATTSGTLLAMHPTTNQQNILRRNGMPNAIPASSHVTRPALSSGLSIPISIDNSRVSMDQQLISPIASVPMCGTTIPDMASEQDWRPARRMRGSISLSSVSGRINPGLVSHYPMQQYHGLQGQPRPSTVSSQLPTVIGNNLMAQRSESHARTGNPAPMM